MIPNLDQLLLVCGIALVFVAAIVWLLMKLPEQEDESPGADDEQ